MTPKQIKTLQTITNDSWMQWKTGHRYDGSMTYSITEIGDKVFLHASNTDTTEWFQKQFIVQVVLGVQGGLNKFKVIL
jgi:hypothetical protein